MLTLKWIGLFVKGEEVRPLTIRAPIGEGQALNNSILRHVNEWRRDGWELVAQSTMTVWEEGDASEGGGSGERRI